MAGLQTTREEEGGGEGEELGVGYKLWPTVAAAGCIPGHYTIAVSKLRGRRRRGVIALYYWSFVFI